MVETINVLHEVECIHTAFFRDPLESFQGNRPASGQGAANHSGKRKYSVQGHPEGSDRSG